VKAEIATLKVSSLESFHPKRQDIRERSFQYGLRPIRLFRYLQKGKDGTGWVLGKQYLRAACSVGANVEEAQASESRADFIHKLGIAQKEARECLFWLRLLLASEIVSAAKLKPLVQESEELVSVLTAIVVNAKRASVR
jgi:four helix bundle protein